MIALTEQQYDYLQHKLLERGLSYNPLVDELVDHLCCLTEEQLAQGLPFDKAAQAALAAFSGNELERVQQTTYEATSKLFRYMKTIRISLFIAYALTLVGMVLKTQQIAFSNELLILGLGFIGTIVMIGAFMRFDSPDTKTTRLGGFFFRLSLALGVVGVAYGVLFISLNLPEPGPNVLVIGGLAFLAIAVVLGLVLRTGAFLSLQSHKQYLIQQLITPLAIVMIVRVTMLITLNR
jgi:hypothetical protein